MIFHRTTDRMRSGRLPRSFRSNPAELLAAVHKPLDAPANLGVTALTDLIEIHKRHPELRSNQFANGGLTGSRGADQDEGWRAEHGFDPATDGTRKWSNPAC